MRSDNLFLDIKNLPRKQVENLPFSDFVALGDGSRELLKTMYPDVYERLNEEKQKKYCQNMTTEEQREAIQKYCLSAPKHCDSCRITTTCLHYGGNPTVMSDIGVYTLYQALVDVLGLNPTEDTNAEEKPLYDASERSQDYPIDRILQQISDMMFQSLIVRNAERAYALADVLDVLLKELDGEKDNSD